MLRHLFGSYSRCSGYTLSYYKTSKTIRFLDCGSRRIAAVAEEERCKSLLLCISLFSLKFFLFGSKSNLVMLL